MKELNFDIIILGGGPAGFAAGIYAARGNVKTALLDISMTGGQPSNYLELENYPGFSTISGYELMEKFEAHADKFGLEKYPMQEIQKINLVGDIKQVITKDTTFNAKSIIIATGAKPQKLNIKGEKEFFGRGVSYCAVCDGAFYKGKTVAVVGGGNSAIEEAIYLTGLADKVYIIHRRDKLRADKIIQERAFKNPKIEFIYNSIPLEIIGEDTVKNILIKNVQTEKTMNISIDGVFPYIGITPNIEFINGQLQQDEHGFIKTDEYLCTSLKGVYAIGDVRTTPLRQVITAAADGAIAAVSAIKYLEEIDTKILA